MADTSAPATGNTPSGRPGAGTTETTSAPTVTPTRAATDRAGAATNPDVVSGPSQGPAVPPAVGDGLSDADFKKDGTLRKATVDRIEETVGPRGAERSYNEVTNETTVTTTVGGSVVTFVEDGDTRGDK